MNATIKLGKATATNADADATGAPAAEPVPTVAELRLPTWFFGFEAVVAGAFDLLNAFPAAWPALVALIVANIAVSLTMLRSRLKLAKLMWRGKGTRKVAFTLVGLRIGSHLLLTAVGLAATSVLAHLAMAVAMAAITIGMLTYVQRTSLNALLAAGKIAA
ncbi:hypothetical protein [Kitasatospora sp. NPDC050543]|uniref:hypothetical protein n=1 Tax=Kitasatospora sp. NPDC050543 TaxID=3364054 RepID=UPI00378BA054